MAIVRTFAMLWRLLIRLKSGRRLPRIRERRFSITLQRTSSSAGRDYRPARAGGGEDAGGSRGDASIDRIFTYAAWADKYDGSVHNPPMRNVTLAMNEAIGVVGIICPTEAPLLGFLSLVCRRLRQAIRSWRFHPRDMQLSSATFIRFSTRVICRMESSISSQGGRRNWRRPWRSTMMSTRSGASATLLTRRL